MQMVIAGIKYGLPEHNMFDLFGKFAFMYSDWGWTVVVGCC